MFQLLQGFPKGPKCRPLLVFFLFAHSLWGQQAVDPVFNQSRTQVTVAGQVYNVADLDSNTVRFFESLVENKIDLLNNQGVDAFENKNFTQAIQYFDKALQLKPDFHQAKINKAVALIEQAEYDKALEIYDKLLESDRVATYWILKGQVELRRKQFRQAIQHFDEALRLDTANAQTLHAVGNAYLQTGKAEKALEYYENALEIQKSTAFYKDMGNAFLSMKEYREAIESYKQAVTLDRKNYQAYANMGKAHYELQEYNLAKEAFLKSIAINERYTPAHINLAATLSFQKDFANAIEHCTKVIEYDSQNALAFLNRGTVKFRLGDAKNACRDWKQAERLGNKEATKLLETNCQ